MAAHLSSGRVNLTALREAGRRELREFLDKCAGSKAIVWDEYLTGPFGLIAQYSLLKEHEVEKMFTLKPGRLPQADVRNIIFFVRPRLELMDIITDNVRREDRGRSPQRDFHILFVPRRSLLCEQWLKEQGVLGSFIHREQYSLDLIPFDGDLLSMESESTFKECYLESDQTSLYHAAKGLMTLQALYGTIPQIFGKGECARDHSHQVVIICTAVLWGTMPDSFAIHFLKVLRELLAFVLFSYTVLVGALLLAGWTTYFLVLK